MSGNAMSRIFLAVTLLLLCAFSTRAKEWRGIIPLHSTRADVERLLGPPTMDRGDTVVYENENERASIEYSKGGPCNSNANIWNIPANTVVSIWVTPRQMYLGDLKLDLKRYQKKQDWELPYIDNYLDEGQGVRYQIDESKSQMITLIEYFPAATDAKLRCPSTRPGSSNRRQVRKPKTNRRARLYPKSNALIVSDEGFQDGSDLLLLTAGESRSSFE